LSRHKSKRFKPTLSLEGPLAQHCLSLVTMIKDLEPL